MSKHVIECQEHYGAVIDAVRDRYFGADVAANSGEWFSGRRDFLAALAHILEEARELRARLSDVEARVQKEKAAWYREVLVRHPYFLDVAERSAASTAAAGSGVNEELSELTRALADEAQSTEDLARVVRKGIGRVRGRPINVEDYLAAVTGAQATGDVKRAKEEVIQFLFEVNGSGKILEGSEKYADMYRTTDDLSIERVIDAIDAARRAATVGSAPGAPVDRQAGPTLGAATSATSVEAQTFTEHGRRREQVRRAQKEQDQRRTAAEEKRRHMDDLQRAKTAHKKIQTAKSEKKHRQLPRELYDTPPCKACSKTVDPKNLIACSLCQVLVLMGLQPAQVTYCSTECFEKAHKNHLEDSHTCEAGKYCIQIRGAQHSAVAPAKDAADLPAAGDENPVSAYARKAHRAIWDDVKSQKQHQQQQQQQQQQQEEEHKQKNEKHRQTCQEKDQPASDANRTHEEEAAAAAYLSNVDKFVESLEDVFQSRIGSKLTGKEVKVEYLPPGK
ncbi:unnamed protein product [Parascedosporium putredinis]|uniref:Uncharacterized protein n=1 Tax=Parascedosporium putredinis TaxID=1442378 RepID=A0A9P1H8Z7_9PEZI|nr:unnamed protein product [Parascedosporium putredinis]CAI8001327.1 unnamed protein product [Parascedosporium putredinis]